MDCTIYSRDGYDLKYDRTMSRRLLPPQGVVQEQPNDVDVLEINDLENALGELLLKRSVLLNEASRDLKTLLDEARFLFERLKALEPSSILNTPPDVFLKRDFLPRRDAFNERNVLQKRKAEAEYHRNVLQTKLKTFLASKVQSFQGKMGGDEDTLLYRVQVKRSTLPTSSMPLKMSNKPSACEWHPLGYRCSGWNVFGEITNEEILNHMNGVVLPTSMISVQESPARLMVFLKKAIMNGDSDTTLIEIISLRMLQHIGILHVRSTDLCDGRGIPTTYDRMEGHAQYVTGTHWVIMNWIPEEALMRMMHVDSFLALAKYRGVIDDVIKRNVLDTDYSIRFCSWDFIMNDVAQLTASDRAVLARQMGWAPGNTLE